MIPNFNGVAIHCSSKELSWDLCDSFTTKMNKNVDDNKKKKCQQKQQQWALTDQGNRTVLHKPPQKSQKKEYTSGTSLGAKLNESEREGVDNRLRGLYSKTPQAECSKPSCSSVAFCSLRPRMQCEWALATRTTI